MPIRPCLDCGTLAEGSRCPACDTPRRRSSRRTRSEAARPSAAARGYGPGHQALRAQWAPLVAAGEVSCWRCSRPIAPGTPWHLGHDDRDRSVHRGPEHRRCNVGASNAR